MTQKRKLFWTGMVVCLLAGYFVTFFWMKNSRAEAESTEASIAARAAVEAGDVAPFTLDGPVAIFAGGCFWCVESDFEKLDGVGDVISGYTGGDLMNPTYNEISKTDTGHREAAMIPYDPAVISYRELVDYFFRHIDPLDTGGQFCDRGPSYKTAIWVQNDEERAAAEAAKAEAESFLGKEVYTPVLDARAFWKAEDRHQDYYKTNPTRYGFYRRGCGRDTRVQALWGKEE